jgi:hypothetical protein
MPDIFKALASITAWVFFIVSWITALITVLSMIITGGMFGDETPPMVVPAFFAVATAEGFLAVVIMKIRKSLE